MRYFMACHCFVSLFLFVCVFVSQIFHYFFVIVLEAWNFSYHGKIKIKLRMARRRFRIFRRMGTLLNLHGCKRLVRSQMFGKHFLENRHIFIDAQTTQSTQSRVAISDWWNECSLCCYDEFLLHAIHARLFPFCCREKVLFDNRTYTTATHIQTHKTQPLPDAKIPYACVCALITSVHPSFGYASTNYVRTSAMNCLILMEGSLRVIRTKMIQMHPAPIHHPLIWPNIALLLQ